MRIHAIMDCSPVNGPGRRAVVWFQGCEIHCPGCWNPSTHRQDGGFATQVGKLAQQIERVFQTHSLEGLTLSGGEPLHQVSELIELVSVVKREVPLLSAGLFSGYAEHELDAGRFLICRQMRPPARRSGASCARCSISQCWGGITATSLQLRRS